VRMLRRITVRLVQARTSITRTLANNADASKIVSRLAVKTVCFKTVCAVWLS